MWAAACKKLTCSPQAPTSLLFPPLLYMKQAGASVSLSLHLSLPFLPLPLPLPQGEEWHGAVWTLSSKEIRVSQGVWTFTAVQKHGEGHMVQKGGMRSSSGGDAGGDTQICGAVGGIQPPLMQTLLVWPEGYVAPSHLKVVQLCTRSSNHLLSHLVFPDQEALNKISQPSLVSTHSLPTQAQVCSL